MKTLGPISEAMTGLMNWGGGVVILHWINRYCADADEVSLKFLIYSTYFPIEVTELHLLPVYQPHMQY